ncbi:AAA family ATPase [Lentilactobacillus kefiri]|uniref:AAA family ATPase n=2 Tax=Lactobacillales TaxID=186826 RepID=UPI000BA5C3DB|nr:AAA family ATPase [Lentilactobacillus kefiri]MCJ2161917.1 AAA family ATPase [Lentilactobacillus kefiri]PAK82913.1 nucleotide-binding protein [Lentilactobacillus kefiri]PAL07346.1 nucleotide-binding protein [Lentilactobacillus kefiri]UOD77586.1 AAA family ATPase [Lentilactobacillus kefiri]
MEIEHASNIHRAQDFTALIYAQPGTGKTSTLKYLTGKTLVVDVDRTTNVLAGQPNIDIVKLDTRNPAQGSRDLLKTIHDNLLTQYDNIAIDNLSEFEQSWFGEKANLAKTRDGRDMGIPQMDNYNQYTYFLPDMIRYINSWPGINKVYTAWETTRQIATPTGQTYNQFIPQIREKIVTNVMGLMNLVGRMVVSDKTGERGFILKPSNAVYAKNQLDDREFALQKDLFRFGGE